MRALVLLALLAGCRTQPLDLAGDGGETSGGDMLSNAEYRAANVPTNLPRISIEKIDRGLNRCTTVLLVGATTGMPQPNLTLPSGWNIERAWQVNSVNACTQLQPPTGAAMANQITGSFIFNPDAPTTVTVHALLVFPTNTDAFDANNIPIK